MRFVAMTALGLTALIFGAACSSTSEREQKLGTALDKAQLSLADSVAIAADTTEGIGVRAALLVDADPVFSVGAMATNALQDVRVDIVTGKVLSTQAASGSAQDCPGSISLAAAIAAAEAEVGGDGVSIEPDDDGECNREVQVLSDGTLWEVKVAPNGSIVESEEADDEEEDDD